MRSGLWSHVLLRQVTVNTTGDESDGHTNKWRQKNLKALIKKKKGDAGLYWGMVPEIFRI